METKKIGQASEVLPTYFQMFRKPINWLLAIAPIGISIAEYSRLKPEGKILVKQPYDAYKMFLANMGDLTLLATEIIGKDTPMVILISTIRLAIISYIRST